MTTEEERATEDYKATLSELDSISKVQINALTMLAEDNKDIAVRIASCIENQLKTASTHKKLPVLYLIDSICKNSPNSIYVQLFTQNIVSNFCNLFQVADVKLRKSLWKLKQTWNNAKTFPLKKLNAIDERINEMDPNWPSLDRQPRKRIKIENQQPLVMPQPQPQPQPAPLIVPLQLPTLPIAQHLPLPAQPVSQMLPPPAPQPIHPQPAPQQLPHPVIPTPMVPIVTVIHENPPPPTPVEQVIVHQQQPPGEPSSHAALLQDPQITTFNQNIMPVFSPHISVLESLYGGKQCSNCSLRFFDNNRYANHLDWHFRKNLRSDVFPRRKWYYPLNLWKKFREINDDVLQENNNNTDNNVNDLLLPVNDNEMVPTAPAFIVDEKNICSVCHETFEKFWAEEEEEWRLKNAKLHDDERVYHPLCLIDMLQADNKVRTFDEEHNKKPSRINY